MSSDHYHVKPGSELSVRRQGGKLMGLKYSLNTDSKRE